MEDLFTSQKKYRAALLSCQKRYLPEQASRWCWEAGEALSSGEQGQENPGATGIKVEVPKDEDETQKKYSPEEIDRWLNGKEGDDTASDDRPVTSNREATGDGTGGSADTAKRHPETLQELKDFGLQFPKRQPGALNGTEFRKKLRQFPALPPEARQKFILEQVALGAIDLKPTIVSDTVGGDQVEMMVTNGLRIGKPGNSVMVAMDGQTAETVADMIGGRLPSKKIIEQLEREAKKAPFFYASKLEGLAMSEGGGKHLADNGKMNGAAMMSEQYASAHSDMLDAWMKRHGMEPNDLVMGSRKWIVMPPKKEYEELYYGGGYHAVPVVKDGKIVDFKVGNQQVQRIWSAHNPAYQDYSQAAFFMAPKMRINGKMVALEKIFTEGKYRHICEKYYGEQPFNPNKGYRRSAWMKQMAARVVSSSDGYDGPPIDTITASDSSKQQPQQQEPLGFAETAGGIPIGPPSISSSGSSGGGSFGGSVVSSGPPSGPDTAFPEPRSYGNTNPAPAPDETRETKEAPPNDRVFVLGDSLSDGFVPGLEGASKKHIHPEGREQSRGQTVHEMVTTLENKILKQDVVGATLVVLGGSNDIFKPGSLPQIKKDLARIWFLAKKAGMKVVGATLPPLAYSPEYSGRFAKQFANQYEGSSLTYEQDLVNRWNELNQWIMNPKDSNGNPIQGPDKVVQLHHYKENPDKPGSILPEETADGVHFKNYGDMAALIQKGVKAVQSQAQQEWQQRAGQEQFPQQSQPPQQPSSQTGSLSPGATVDSGSSPVTMLTGIESGPLPAGTRRIASVPPSAQRIANKLLHQLGHKQWQQFEVDGKKYVAIKEIHPAYGPSDRRPDGRLLPQKPHGGISVLALEE